MPGNKNRNPTIAGYFSKVPGCNFTKKESNTKISQEFPMFFQNSYTLKHYF